MAKGKKAVAAEERQTLVKRTSDDETPSSSHPASSHQANSEGQDRIKQQQQQQQETSFSGLLTYCFPIRLLLLFSSSRFVHIYWLVGLGNKFTFDVTKI